MLAEKSHHAVGQPNRVTIRRTIINPDILTEAQHLYTATRNAAAPSAPLEIGAMREGWSRELVGCLVVTAERRLAFGSGAGLVHLTAGGEPWGGPTSYPVHVIATGLTSDDLEGNGVEVLAAKVESLEGKCEEAATTTEQRAAIVSNTCALLREAGFEGSLETMVKQALADLAQMREGCSRLTTKLEVTEAKLEKAWAVSAERFASIEKLEGEVARTYEAQMRAERELAATIANGREADMHAERVTSELESTVAVLRAELAAAKKIAEQTAAANPFEEIEELRARVETAGSLLLREQEARRHEVGRLRDMEAREAALRMAAARLTGWECPLTMEGVREQVERLDKLREVLMVADDERAAVCVLRKEAERRGLKGSLFGATTDMLDVSRKDYDLVDALLTTLDVDALSDGYRGSIVDRVRGQAKEIEALREQVGTHAVSVSEANEERDRLAEQVEYLKSSRAAADNATLAPLRAPGLLSTCGLTEAAPKRVVAMAVERLQQQAKEIERLRAANADLAGKVASAPGSGLRKRLRAAQAEVAALKQEVEAAKERVDMYAATTGEANADRARLAEQNEALRRKVAELEASSTRSRRVKAPEFPPISEELLLGVSQWDRWPQVPACCLVRDNEGDVWHVRSDRARNLVFAYGTIAIDKCYSKEDKPDASAERVPYAPLTLVALEVPDELTEETLRATLGMTQPDAPSGTDSTSREYHEEYHEGDKVKVIRAIEHSGASTVERQHARLGQAGTVLEHFYDGTVNVEFAPGEKDEWFPAEALELVEAALPRIVKWTELEPGDLALDPCSPSGMAPMLLVRKSGNGEWRFVSGARSAQHVRLHKLGPAATDGRHNVKSDRCILLARGVKANAAVVARNYNKTKDAAAPLTEQLRGETDC